ncbi:type II secretion system minor pseudopilin GspK [Brevundimonas sp. 2R-24]|uniref:Type II secretion system protein K n=1 Tax=Peiella sedimenti TaxID=3061083 RepID=A0ABT8SJ57_9CAUL|nr:type II secretion system minor pseudopilin GspK [Caulobacteraceae bacterium XZ-24]
MRDDERGAALLTVLLLVAVISALAVAVLDDMRFGIRRAANVRDQGQARWLALGAEAMARGRLERLIQGSPDLTPLEAWSGRSLTLPGDDGALIKVSAADAGDCFNLNSVVQGRGEYLIRRDEGVAQFIALAEAVDIPRARAEMLAAALVDWIDQDSFPSPRGAEDGAYAAGAPAYRTGNTLLADSSEVRAIRGFDAPTWRALQPYVCVLPSSDLSPINPNALTREDALLLSVITDGQLSPDRAAALIRARPGGGWTSLEAFWGQPALAQITPPPEALEQVRLTTHHARLRVQVRYQGAEIVLNSLFEAAGGRVRLVGRRWSAA